MFADGHAADADVRQRRETAEARRCAVGFEGRHGFRQTSRAPRGVTPRSSVMRSTAMCFSRRTSPPRFSPFDIGASSTMISSPTMPMTTDGCGAVELLNADRQRLEVPGDDRMALGIELHRIARAAARRRSSSSASWRRAASSSHPPRALPAAACAGARAAARRADRRPPLRGRRRASGVPIRASADAALRRVARASGRPPFAAVERVLERGRRPAGSFRRAERLDGARR